MKCPKCQTVLTENSTQCNECGYKFRSGEHPQVHSVNSKVSDEKEPTRNSETEGVLKPLSGFRRTLSTELVGRQTQLRTLMELNALVETRTFEPGEVLIRKGDANRDIFFLTDGLVEISIKKEDASLTLNEIEPPYILGDIAFLSGFPRTATAKAKTKVKIFILKYDKLENLFKEFPDWLGPLLTSFASEVKSLHFRVTELKREVMELRGNPE